MKKITVLVLFFLFLITIIYNFRHFGEHKVLKIEDSADFYIDLNDNDQIDYNELIEVYGVIPFSFDNLENNSFKNINLNKKEIVYLSYFSKKWAKEKALGKYVKVKFKNKNAAIIIINGKDYSQNLLKNGFALADKNSLYDSKQNLNAIKKYIYEIQKNHYVVFNNKSKKFHELDCDYALKVNEFEIIPYKNLPKEAAPCGFCHKKPLTKSTYNFTPIHKIPYFIDLKNIKIFFIDFSNTKKPYNDCSTIACTALLTEINNTKHTMDFAVYGILNQPKVYNAITNAQKRGVKIRWVTDIDSEDNTYYPDTLKLMNVVKNYNVDSAQNNIPSTHKRFQNAIMHNKFFIFDNEKVWTGSANLTDTDFSDFNANLAILIDSAQAAKIFGEEFERLYKGDFHNNKTEKTINNEITFNDNNKIKIYFSPQDKIISNHLIKLIENSRNYIYVPIFYFTSKPMAQSLIEAHKRGVDIKVITDATNANNKYSVNTMLKSAGIKVKTENKAGKMHIKSMIIDDKYSIIGSMNFTKSGENTNDENVVILEDTKTASYLKLVFTYLWNSIPDKYLNYTPSAESFASVGSCTDSIDNDFDGKIDKNDEGCLHQLNK